MIFPFLSISIRLSIRLLAFYPWTRFYLYQFVYSFVSLAYDMTPCLVQPCTFSKLFQKAYSANCISLWITISPQLVKLQLELFHIK